MKKIRMTDKFKKQMAEFSQNRLSELIVGAIVILIAVTMSGMVIVIIPTSVVTTTRWGYDIIYYIGMIGWLMAGIYFGYLFNRYVVPGIKKFLSESFEFYSDTNDVKEEEKEVLGIQDMLNRIDSKISNLKDTTYIRAVGNKIVALFKCKEGR